MKIGMSEDVLVKWDLFVCRCFDCRPLEAMFGHHVNPQCQHRFLSILPVSNSVVGVDVNFDTYVISA